MYNNEQQIDGENKPYRHGDGFRAYHQRLAANREALDIAFTERVQAQKLAAIGASVQLEKLQSQKAPGSPSCADNCSCLYCQKTAALTAIAQQGLKLQEVETQQLVASANKNNKDSSAPAHRRPRWDLKASHYY